MTHGRKFPVSHTGVMSLGESPFLETMFRLAGIYVLMIIYIGSSGGIKVIVHTSFYHPIKYVVPAQSLLSPHPQQHPPSEPFLSLQAPVFFHLIYNTV